MPVWVLKSNQTSSISCLRGRINPGQILAAITSRYKQQLMRWWISIDDSAVCRDRTE